MGCCSGRCTLAFICGMQLVSVKITIDPVQRGLNGQICVEKEKFFFFGGGGFVGVQQKQVMSGNRKRHIFTSVTRHGAQWKDGWMEGKR